MIYYIFRLFIRFVLRFFIKNLEIRGLDNVPKSGAVLLAAMHPNSFFDAILLACLLDRPLWSLARGDAFKNKWLKNVFYSFKMMPIYRLSEGKEFLEKNEDTFQQCIELFRNGEMILIFPEGICTHQTSLLPLKKGTARLAQLSWQAGIEMSIVPVIIKYDSFFDFGKNISVCFEKTLSQDYFQNIANKEGQFLNEFNIALSRALSNLNYNEKPKFLENKWIYYGGLLFNFPVYFVCKQIAKILTKGTVFYDSVLFGIMIFMLPIYWGLILYLLV